MVHARPFSTSTLQGLSNGIKNSSRQGVLTPAIELRSCGSPEGLQVLTFGNANLILTLASKWGCDNNKHKFLCFINDITTFNIGMMDLIGIPFKTHLAQNVSINFIAIAYFLLKHK